MATKLDSETEANDLASFVVAAETALDAGSRLTLSIGGANHDADGATASAVLRLLAIVASGQTVELDALPRLLTTGQAADLLGVSRPTVASLVDSGALPATLVGTHRRIELVELLAYRDKRRTDRREALNEVSRISQDLGLYETG